MMAAQEWVQELEQQETLRDLYATYGRALVWWSHWTPEEQQGFVEAARECKRAFLVMGYIDQEFRDWLSSMLRAWKRGRTLNQQKFIHKQQYGRLPEDWETPFAIEFLRTWNHCPGDSAFAQWIEEQTSAGND